jgi:hypothetical protein
MKSLLSLNPNTLEETDHGWNESALHHAAKNGKLNAIKYLLSEGAIIDRYSKKIMRPMELAQACGHNRVADYLKRVFEVIAYTERGDLSEIQKWVADGNSLNFRFAHGRSLLFQSYLFKRANVTLYLFEQGVPQEWRNSKDVNALQHFLQCEYKDPQNVFNLFKEMAKLLKESERSESERKALTEILETELDKAVLYARENLHLFVDYQELAIHFNKKYWCKLATEIYKLEKSDWNFMGTSSFDYKSEKEKLSHLIYSGTVIAKESKEGLEFEVGDLVAKETEEERYNRLSWALKFVLDAEDFASAMRISIEMTTEDTTLLVLREGIHKASTVKSSQEFAVKLIQFHYKSQSGPKLRDVAETGSLEPLSLEELDCSRP